MNSFVMWLIIWRLDTSFSEMMIMKPIEISKSNILRTIKIQTITACWVECQQTAGCETIGTDPEVKNKHGSESTDKISLKATEICPFIVSCYEFVYSIFCST